MEVMLKPNELELVKRILTNYLSDLRMEIADTEDFNLRQDLKADEETIKGVIARIEEASERAA